VTAIMTLRQVKHQECLEKLYDLNCDVVSVAGSMYIVKYHLNQVTLSYAYHENKNGSYFLERIKPYIMPAGDFQNELAVVDAIEIDIEQFKNAEKSSHFSEFIEDDKILTGIVRSFEDLFLYYNIESNDLESLKSEINNVHNLIFEIKNKSSRVFTKKNPEFL